MKLVGFVVLGLAVTITVYCLIVFLILDDLLMSLGVQGPNIAITFLIILPFALLLGSILTGYLSYPSIETKRKLIGIAPGLYLVGLMIVPGMCMFSAIVVEVFYMVLFGLYLYLVSLAGTGLGYLLRSCIRRLNLFGRMD